MMKALLLRLALGLVIDVLIQLATKKLQDAKHPMNVEKWQVIVDFLEDVKRTGLP